MHRREGKLILAATDLVGFLECGHLTNLERQADAGLIHKPTQREDPEVLLLQRRGHAHEARYIEFLETQGRTITHGDEDWEHSYEDRAATTDRLMREGAEVIYQATVFHGQWVGFPDFLLRKGEPGELGKDHHYEVADTKLAHTAKASALIQICSYVEQIERLQGVRPEKVYVVTGGAEIKEHPFRTAEMMAYYRHAKGRFEAALATQLDARSTYPDPVGHCDVCRWRPVCDHQWRQDD
ncbi:MAG: nuclease, partial [Chloroflexota bacterium]